MAKNEVKIIVSADAKGASAEITGFVSQLKSNWLEMSAMAAGAFFAIKKVYRDFAAAAEREEKRMAFTNLAATFRSNADSIIADLKRMSGQSITTGRAIELAGRSMLSGLDPRAMPGLMEFAKTTTKVTGGSAADTFEDFTRAIITGQDRMLRMHGITVDFAKAQKDLATSMGGTVEQLNEQQTQYANLTALLETATTMTARLGKDAQSVGDELAAISTRLSESYEKLSDSFWKTFGSGAIYAMEIFAERLDEIRKIAHMIAYPFQKAGQGLDWLLSKGQYAPATGGVGAEDFQPNIKGRGITSVKKLGFSFDEQLGPGLQSLKDYTEEMKLSLGELAKGEKDVTKEVAAQIKYREAEIQLQLKEIDLAEQEFRMSKSDAVAERVRLYEELQRIQGEYLVGLDKISDPASWYAQQNAINQTREALVGLNLEMQKQTGTFAEGAKYGFQQWQHDAKTSFEHGTQAAQDAANGIQDFFSNISFDAIQGKLKTLGDYFRNFLTSMQRSISNILGQLAMQGIMMGIGALFPGAGAASAATTGSASLGFGGMLVHSGGYIPRFHFGGLASDEVPAILQRGEYVVNRRAVDAVGRSTLDKINNGSGGTPGGNKHYYVFVDPSSAERYAKMSKRQVEASINALLKDNRLKNLK